jgi:hypothetical protein
VGNGEKTSVLFIGNLRRFEGKNLPGDPGGGSAGGAEFRGEVNCGAVGRDWSASDAMVAGGARGGAVQWM